MGFLNDNFYSDVAAPSPSAYQMPGTQQGQGPTLQGGLAARLAAAQNQPGPNLAPVNQTLGQSQTLASQLAATAAGRGTSPADLQLQQGLQTQLAQQRAAAASAGPNTNPYLVQRSIAQQAAGAAQATNAQAAIQRAQETQTAQQAEGGVLNSMAGTGLNEAQLGLQAAQNSNQAQEYYTGQQLALSQAQLQANENQQALAAQTALGNNQINAGVSAANTAQTTALLGGAFGGIASGIGALFSDENLKESVSREVDNEMREFLTKLDPASYEYRDKGLGKGRHWSVMAQSAQKSKVGKSFVIETPVGLALDPRKGFGVALAALKHMSNRQDKLEQLIANPKRV